MEFLVRGFLPMLLQGADSALEAELKMPKDLEGLGSILGRAEGAILGRPTTLNYRAWSQSSDLLFSVRAGLRARLALLNVIDVGGVYVRRFKIDEAFMVGANVGAAVSTRLAQEVCSQQPEQFAKMLGALCESLLGPIGFVHAQIPAM